MTLTKKAKNYLATGIVFAVLAILFTLLYYFNAIKSLDLYVAVTYVVYFVGMALFYNGAFCNQQNYKKAKIFNYLLATVFILIAITMLIYGFASGRITFLN